MRDVVKDVMNQVIMHKIELWSVHDIKRLYDEKRLYVEDFQRDDVWKRPQKSRLIESILRKIPIPSIYLAEDEDDKYVIIDGQQRINAIVQYLNDEYGLDGLTIYEKLKNQRYSNLSNSDKIKISDAKIPVTIITRGSDPDIKYEIFERLNTGALQLNAQELRNCIYRGNYNNLLKELSNDEDFKFLLGSSWKIMHNRMRDAELILRFFAFSRILGIHIEDYKPPMKRFLNHEMKDHRELSEVEIQKLKEMFKKSVSLTKKAFGKNAFKKFEIGSEEDENGKWSKQINKSLFDIVMCGFAMYPDVDDKLDIIREELIYLTTEDNEFIEAITKGTSDYRKTNLRFRKWYAVMKQVSENSYSYSLETKRRIYNDNPDCHICGKRIQVLDDATIVDMPFYWRENTIEGAKLAHRYCNITSG